MEAATGEGRRAESRTRGLRRIWGRLAAEPLSIPAAARELGVPAATVRLRVDDGSLRSIRRGSRDYVRWADLVAYAHRTT